jgi:hypothetical protein
MDVEIQKEIKVTLILDKDEAVWLRKLMQNPLYNVTLEEEDTLEQKMRMSFWYALDTWKLDA